MNLFPSTPPSTDKYELFIQRISTIIFILLSIGSLTISLMYFLPIMSSESSTRRSVMSPSFHLYSALYSSYANTLTCTCTEIAINYGQFVHVKYTLHQVCISIFVTDKWISSLVMSNEPILYGDDFRVTSPYAFQALRMLCELVNRTISDSLDRFYSSQYVGASVSNAEMFYQQTASAIEQFRSSMTNSFLLSLQMIRGTTQVNALFSGLQTNYGLYGEKDSNNVFVAAKIYNGCSCAFFVHCIQQSSIYNPSAAKVFNVPGFYTGCHVIESLLQSTLQCFYNQTCIDIIQSYLSSASSSIHVLALDSSLPSIYDKNSTIKTLLDRLMIDQLQTTISYSNYYQQCNPKECTYTTTTNRMESNVINIVIIMFLIVGGPVPVLKVIMSILTKFSLCCIRKSTRQVVPETFIIAT